jgi:hypothetical protein
VRIDRFEVDASFSFLGGKVDFLDGEIEAGLAQQDVRRMRTGAGRSRASSSLAPI